MSISSHPRIVAAWDEVQRALDRYEAVVAEVVMSDDGGTEVLARWCEWHLGDARWANRILAVLADPSTAAQQLAADSANDNEHQA